MGFCGVMLMVVFWEVGGGNGEFAENWGRRLVVDRWLWYERELFRREILLGRLEREMMSLCFFSSFFFFFF